VTIPAILRIKPVARGLAGRTELSLIITPLGYTFRDACDVRLTLTQKILTISFRNVQLTEDSVPGLQAIPT
jgi:hypothetical protein